MKRQYLEIGKIVNVHGLNGVVKVHPWCDSAEFLTGFRTLYRGGEHRAVKIERAVVQKNMVLMKIAGVDTVEAAEALRGTVLYMNRDDVELDENTYFIQDLIGLTVQDADSGKIYGKVTDVMQTGANDVYEITSESGKVQLCPVIPQVVLDIDFEKEIITIRPLEGLFEDAD